MNKSILAASMAMALGATGTAEAVFTGIGDGVYRLTITGGCFDFGNCQTSGKGVLTDNLTTNEANTSNFAITPNPPYGSGITNDGVMGVIDFTLSGGSMTVTSFSQDSYQGTAGGTFYLRSTNLGTMGGTISGTGDMSFDPTGRQGLAANFLNTLGEQEWNRDDPTLTAPGTGLYDQWTTGTSSNDQQGLTPGFTMTGSPIQDAAVNTWTATLVSAGNIGQAWGASFDGTQYSELFNITINLVSADPVANDDTISGPEGSSILIDIASDLLANDTHADATESIIFNSFTQPLDVLSSVVDNSNGTLTYTPNPALTAGIGVDSFTYTVVDNNGDPDTATVNITLTPASATPPVANDDSVSTNEDTQLTFDPVAGSTTGVVLDTDADPGQTATLVISAFDGISANLGTVIAGVGNNLIYTPAADFFGADAFQYAIQDDDGLTDSATVTVNVIAVNDPPVCQDIDLTVAINTTLTINTANDILSTCSDKEGDTLSLDSISQPSQPGSMLVDDGAGVSYTYTPATDFSGLDTISYTVTDGLDTGTKTINIQVSSNNLGNFTMLEAAGNVFGGTNDVRFTWDGVSFNTDESDTNFDLMTIASETPQPFFGFVWSAHHVRVYSTGTYTFDTTCTVPELEAGATLCNNPLEPGQTQQFITMTVAAGQVGAHMLFDWNTAVNIDVVNVWDKGAVWDTFGDAPPKNQLWLGAAGLSPDPATTWELVSTDVNGDGIHGSPMIDGPFNGYYANFNAGPGGTAPPPEPYTGTAPDTRLGDSLFVSPMNPWVLVTGLMALLGLRRYSQQ